MATVSVIEEKKPSLLMSMPGQHVNAIQVAQGVPKSDQQIIPNTNLFKVMRIVLDKQDFYLVEKVQLAEDGILSLCNKLVPASASAFLGNPPQNRVNFKALNGLYLSSVGFYGDKKMMIDIFGKQRLLGDSILSQMEVNQFEPGLYVIVPENPSGSLIVFYWHEGEQFKEASRKDVSCNFIRYLVELCDSVYICVKKGYDFDALAASAIREPSNSGRHMKLEVKKVNGPESDMELLPGFNVRMAVQVKVEKYFPLFCEGYYHCCFLTAEYRNPRTYRRTEEGYVRASEFCNMVDKWSWESHVDYSRMSNKNFLNLLQYCYPREYQEFQNYCKWIDSFKVSGNSGFMTGEVENGEKFFLKALPEFCSNALFLVSGEENQDYMDRFDQLHHQLSMMLTGYDVQSNGGCTRVLFYRSAVKFICNGLEHRITIEVLGKGKPTLPFISYEKELNVMCSGQCSCSRSINGKARFLPINGPKHFLSSGDRVKLSFSNDVNLNEHKMVEMEGTVQLLTIRDSVRALHGWVENMVPTELKSLERNIIFTTFLMTCDKSKALKFIEHHLKIDNLQSLPFEFSSLVTEFQNIKCSQPTMDRKDLLSYQKIRTTCCQVYKEEEVKFLKNVRKELSNVLSCYQGTRDQAHKSYVGGVGKELTTMEEENEKQRKQAQDQFVQDLKRKMSKGTKDTSVTRYIEEIDIKHQSTKWTPWSYTDLVELKFKVIIVEEQKVSIVWKAYELTPMRKQRGELSNNSEHSIIPRCSQPVELVTINPEHERLLKVVVLRAGEMIVFIHSFRHSSLFLYHCPKIGFNINNTSCPTHTFKRGFDLLDIDESTRHMALYDKDKSKIAIYKFDEIFRKVYWTGIDVLLETFNGNSTIIWMHFIPGKLELLLVDDINNVKVVEIHKKPTMKAKHISLPWSQPLSKACVSADGLFLVAFREFQSSVEIEGHVDAVGDGTKRRLASLGIQLEIFVLGDKMEHLKTVYLNANPNNMCDLKRLRIKITNFGSQSHLVLYSHPDAPGFLSSHVLKTVIAGEVLVSQQIQSRAMEMEETGIEGSCSYLEYICHIFDKFGTIPALFPQAKKRVTFKVLIESSTHACNGNACIRYLQAVLEKLRRRKEKDFSCFRIDFQVESSRKWTTEFGCLDSISANEMKTLKMGKWVRLLICLVPLQIARAEKNGVVALKDGLQIPPYINYVDSISLASSIRFGFYDAILNSWEGKIKVISSMGKQSSGKSYLLNHLSGSLFDVSGGRCTDGLWMSLVVREDSEQEHTHTCEDTDCICLYVLLDFEGLGSLERTEQEDMLLSVVSAGLSNLTIFNQQDFHVDRDTESAFSRFQAGINLIKQDQKLFKGLFYIAVKDVDTSDVDDLIKEFNDKISQICSRSEESFITKMYEGKVVIAAMGPYNRSDYYMGSLSELAGTVKKMDSFYDNGSTFLRDLKLVISQIAAKDWSSIDGKRMALIANIIRTNLMSAINMGWLSAANEDDVQGLVNFNTQEEIPDAPIIIGDFFCNIRDQGLCLAPSSESQLTPSIRDVLCRVRSSLETALSREGNNGEIWHSMFENILQALGERRRDRVQQWICSNTTEFHDNEEVKRLQLEASFALAEVKQRLSVCGRKCSLCFWRCVLEKGHDQYDPNHSCMASHSCREKCSFCFREGENFTLCGDLAGHEGAHDCKGRNHTCGEICHLAELAFNCHKVCYLRPEHLGQHRCNSPQHNCSTKCSLPTCNNPCAVVIDSSHEKHQCHQRHCQSKCTVDGCSRTCGVQDHLHDLYPDAEHLCGNEHACPEECEMPGICEIVTKLVRETRTFEGQRGPFEYEHVSEQNGLRKRCCAVIPPYEMNHHGPHVHTKNVDSVHYCDARCEACGYLCQLPIDHSGFHDTVHGNMKNVRFVSDVEDIEIEDRKYKWGEKGEAEMCNMYCKKKGRGHIHFVPCPGSEKCTGNLHHGSRHQTVKYGPNVDVPKDEMTHETYWRHVRFIDPCTKEERREFNLCGHYCKHEEHKEGTEVSDKSYCTKELWHPLLTRSVQNKTSSNYVTDDGHHFVCSHAENAPHHVIFVIDRSRSMGKSDITPTMAMFNKHNCRLGCVYEAILKFIQIRLKAVCTDSISVVLFGKSARVAIEMEDMEEKIVESLLQYHPAHFTDFDWGEASATGFKIAEICLELGTGLGTGIANVYPLACSAAKIPGWGTHYSSGLDAAKKLMVKAARDPSVKMKKPLVVFLSDGENNGGDDPVDCVEQMKEQEQRMTLDTILYGNDSKTDILKRMATAADGKFHNTLNGIQLIRSFEHLAESLRNQVAGFI